MNRLLKYLKYVVSGRPVVSRVDERINYSLKKYKKTYKLLEEYDKKATGDPEALAGSGRLRKYIEKFRLESGWASS